MGKRGRKEDLKTTSRTQHSLGVTRMEEHPALEKERKAFLKQGKVG